jgi:hypothetical protein
MDPHHFGKQDPDPDPHQREIVEALEGHSGALEGPNLGKSVWSDPDPDPHQIERSDPDPRQSEK